MKHVILLVLLVGISTVIQGIPHQMPSQHPPAIPQTASGTSGLVYLSPTNTTNQVLGTNITVEVHVSDMPSFSGWDVYVRTNSSVIDPVSANIAGNLLAVNDTKQTFITGECIDDKVVVTACPPVNGPGILELGVGFIGINDIQPPVSGLLFSITYVVRSNTGYSQVLIDNSTTTFANGSTGKVPYSVQNGIYGSQKSPDLLVSANPSTVTVTAGYNATTTVKLTSTLGFSGLVNLTALVELQGSPTSQIIARFSNQLVLVRPYQSNGTLLTLTTANSTSVASYTITVTGVGPNTLTRQVTIPATVILPNSFIIGVSPGSIKVHEGLNGTAQILLESYGFNGTVSLTVQTYLVKTLGVLVPISLAYSLVARNITLQASPSPFIPRLFTTNITVTTPLTSLPFKYQLSINATDGSMIAQGTLIVVPPPVSLSVTVTPSTIFVRSGKLASTTILVNSVDYFWGFLSASAIMSGAAVSFNSSIYYIALPNSSNSTVIPWQSIGMTVNVTAYTPPGNYVALLTVYSLATNYQRAFSTQVEVPVVVQAAPGAAAGKVFGLPVMLYYEILAALAVPLGLLSVLVFVRREKEEEHDWRA